MDNVPESKQAGTAGGRARRDDVPESEHVGAAGGRPRRDDVPAGERRDGGYDVQAGYPAAGGRSLAAPAPSKECKTGLFLSPPKSLSSVREIPLPDFLVQRLRLLEKEGGFVLNRDGRPIEPRVYSRRFQRLLREAGLSPVKFHTLRHTFATRALELGFDLKTLSELLGHSSTATTLKLYAHSLPEHKRREMQRLGEIFDTPSE